MQCGDLANLEGRVAGENAVCGDTAVFPGTKMVVDRADGRLLGLQCVGPGDVGRQIASGALAVMGGLKVSDLVNSDLPYAPPFSLAIDNFIATAHIMENKLKKRMKGISAEEVKQLVEKKKDIFILDVRGPDEYEIMRLGIGEVLIPLGALRKRVNELPADKKTTVICFCKISLRGWEAVSYLAGRGYSDVRVMEGGIMAWPYPREN
jgi:rhodanese-related sulfurtransferase